MSESRRTTAELIRLVTETRQRVIATAADLTALTQELRRRLDENDDEGDPRDGSE